MVERRWGVDKTVISSNFLCRRGSSDSDSDEDEDVEGAGNR